MKDKNNIQNELNAPIAIRRELDFISKVPQGRYFINRMLQLTEEMKKNCIFAALNL